MSTQQVDPRHVCKALILTVGLPRSGKTTWARKQRVPIVSPDEIRLALHGQRFRAEAEPMVWAIAKTMVRALFGAGHHTLILDACSVSQKRRAEWLDGSWRLFARPFSNFPGSPATETMASPATCMGRARRSDRLELVAVIDRMAAELEDPRKDAFQARIVGTLEEVYEFMGEDRRRCGGCFVADMADSKE